MKTFFSRKLPICPLKSTFQRSWHMFEWIQWTEIVWTIVFFLKSESCFDRLVFVAFYRTLNKKHCNDCKFVEMVRSLISNFLYSKSSFYINCTSILHQCYRDKKFISCLQTCCWSCGKAKVKINGYIVTIPSTVT